MKNNSYLKVLLLAVGLTLGFQAASAQIATLVDKQAHQNTLDDNYDQWKRSVTRSNETGPNILITSSTNGGFTTHTVQLGYNVTDQSEATFISDKIAAQPGVISITADHTTNRVVYTVKEDDEHNSLDSYFDIQ
jgi:hypothetical protein